MAHKDRWNTNTLIEILLGAADLVGRSPYPLVEAAGRVGFDCASRAFKQAKIYRDRARSALVTLNAETEAFNPFQLQLDNRRREALLEAAIMLQEGEWP